MRRWTIFTMVYGEYELLRNLIESILGNVNPDSYERIMVVDDYSRLDTRLREYEEYLKRDPLFDVYNFDEHKQMAFYVEDKRSGDPPHPNMGHGGTFNYAIPRVKTEFLLYVDVDCIFLSSARDMLFDIERVFDSDERIMAAGQLFGVNDYGSIYSERFTFFHAPAGRDSVAGGYVGPSAGALRVSGWADGYIPTFTEDRRLPNLLNEVSEGIFVRGGKVASYPWFTNMNILHLGRGVVRRYTDARRGAKDTDWFVFCRDFVRQHGPRFGPRDLRSNHYGRGFVNMTSRQYREYLELKGREPFNKVNPPLDEALVYTVD